MFLASILYCVEYMYIYVCDYVICVCVTLFCVCVVLCMCLHKCACVSVCVYVCMSTYVVMYVCVMYVCTHAWLVICEYIRIDVKCHPMVFGHHYVCMCGCCACG